MFLFDAKAIFFTVLDYDMSYLEFFGVITGLMAIVLSARANIWSWPVGIVNVVLAFFLYYQVQLYPDMFLQIFYFVTNILGWWRWANPKIGEENSNNELRASNMGLKKFLMLCSIGLVGTVILGKLASNLHEWFPSVFTVPSAFPYADSFLTVMSIVTTFVMIEKKFESWIIWIVVDITATWLYYVKGIKFFALEYFIFCFIASYGLLHWIKERNIANIKRVA